jgi:uncharacterized protein (TIRG00374 family)
MRKLIVNGALSLLVGVAMLWFTLDRMLADIPTDGRPVGQVILQSIADLPWWALPAYGASFLVVHVARILRWVEQVRPLGETDRRLVFRVCAIGYAAIVLFPWRLGEVVRPYLLARESKNVSFAAAAGTTVTERIIDGLLITLLFFVCTATAPQAASDVVRSSGLISLAVFSSATVGIVLFAWQRPLALWLLRNTFGRVHAGVAAALERLMQGFLEGLSSLKASGALGSFVILTVIYWSANAGGIWLLATAFGIELPFMAGFGLLSVLVIGIMLPAGPGFLGNFQFFLGEGLRLYVPALTVASFGFSLSMNLVQLLLQVGFAVPFLLMSGLGLRGLIEVQRQAST